MTVISVNDLNCSSRRDKKKFISDCENKYSEKVNSIAEKICREKEETPIVLIAGPSGSGKTTTAKRIQQRLKEKGSGSIAISMDDYYLPKNSPKIPYNDDGTPDLESPYRLDIDLLKEHFEKIFKCEEIEIPKFDFSTQSRLKGDLYKRKHDDIVILEGIHALNPVISGEISPHAMKIYISVRTRLKLENSKIIHPSVIRLMRRLSRDLLYRGKDVEGVFNMFESVSYGEKKYISPYKKYSDIDLDTYLSYEVQIYKNLLKDKIKKQRDKLYQNERYKDIVRVFDDIEEIDGKEDIPENSLIREFV